MDFLAGLLEPFHWQFMRNALLAVLVISPLFGLLSTMVVTSRMSFFSDALGHSAFTGIAIGTLCGLADPLWMAVLLAAVFALLFTYVRRKSNMASDTVIGVFSSTAVALGIFISTLGGRSFTKFNALLIGDILSVEPGKIALLAVILLVVVLLWLCSFNQLMLSSIHPALADSRGVKVFWQETVFSVAIAVVVNLVVGQLIPVIDTAVMMFVNVTHKKLTEETILTHRMITEAIARHDPIGARSAMVMHLNFNRNCIRKLYDGEWET